jgi:hypothetical protein
MGNGMIIEKREGDQGGGFSNQHTEKLAIALVVLSFGHVVGCESLTEIGNGLFELFFPPN